MFRKLVLLLSFIYCLNAGSLSLTGPAFSKHFNDGYNSEHDWIGLKLDYLLDKDLLLGFEYSKFINSYDNLTKVYVVNATYLPYEYYNFKFGLNFGIGYQKGYCITGIDFKHCSQTDKNESLVLIPSLQTEAVFFDYKFGLNILPISDALTGRFYLNILEW